MPEVNQPAAEPPTTYQEQIALLRPHIGLAKLAGYLALVYLLTFVVLGAVFMAMLVPITGAFRRLAYISTAAYHLWGRMIGVKELPAQLAKPPIGVVIWSSIWIVAWLALVAILLRLVFFIGFCNQNVLCFAGRWLLK